MGTGNLLTSLITSAQELSESGGFPQKIQTKTPTRSKGSQNSTGRSQKTDDGLALLVLIVCAITLVFISPGLILNLATARFRGHPDGFFWASVHDFPTWLFSSFFWICIVLLRYRIKRRLSLWAFFVLFMVTAVAALFSYHFYMNHMTMVRVPESARTERPGSAANQIPQSRIPVYSSPDQTPDDVAQHSEIHSLQTTDNTQPPTEQKVAVTEEPKRMEGLTFRAQHKHTLGGCEGTLTFFPDEIRFESNSHSFSSHRDQVTLHKDGIKDSTGKRWHFNIDGQSVSSLFLQWKNGTLLDGR